MVLHRVGQFQLTDLGAQHIRADDEDETVSLLNGPINLRSHFGGGGDVLGVQPGFPFVLDQGLLEPVGELLVFPGIRNKDVRHGTLQKRGDLSDAEFYT